MYQTFNLKNPVILYRCIVNDGRRFELTFDAIRAYKAKQIYVLFILTRLFQKVLFYIYKSKLFYFDLIARLFYE